MSRMDFFDFVRRYGAQEERNDRVLTDELAYEILSVVAEIPRGRVATYGQIARLVGKVLSRAEYYGAYPCHRVVNHVGRLVPGWQEQGELLRGEGVELKDEHHADLKRYRWEA